MEARPASILDIEREFRRLKSLADGAVAQLDEADLYRTLDGEINSIAVLMKHLAGNLRSRWRDFLNSDGEKPDRHRDTEFEIDAADTKDALFERWDAAWSILFETISNLDPKDLDATITIRGEPHSVTQAIYRQLTHYGYHVGQIVLLARHWKGDDWQTLSVAKGKSREFNANPDSYLRG